MRGIIVQQVNCRWRKGSAHGRSCDRLKRRSEVLVGWEWGYLWGQGSVCVWMGGHQQWTHLSECAELP